METPTKSVPAFEAVLDDLQKTVRALESGALPLEESLKAYEKGMSLVRSAQLELQKAEKRIEILTQHALAEKNEA